MSDNLHRRARRMALLLSATCLGAPAVGFAQASAGAPQNQSVALEEIVVTAQKRAENLQEVPIAVTALTQSRMEKIGVSNTLDLNVAVPTLNTVSSLGFVKPFLRGVGSVGNGAGLEPPVAVYVDGVYYASAPSALFSFNNIERIEVLKGPQGTLFGRNATGGLIHVITADPTTEPELRLSAGVDNYATVRLGVYAAGPITSAVKGGVAVQYGDQGEGYGKNLFTGADANKLLLDLSVRGRLLVDLGPDTTLRLNGDYFHRKTSYFSFRPVRGYPPRFIAASAVPSNVWDVNSDFPPANDAEGGGASVRLDHDFGGVRLMSLTAYRKTDFHYGGDSDATPANVLASDSFIHDRQFTQELQLLSDTDSRVQWVLGAYYFNYKSALDPQNIIFGPPLAPLPTSTRVRVIDAHFPAESLAGFAQVTAEILPDTFLTLGGRYTIETKKVRSTVTGIRNNGQVVALFPANDDSIKAKEPTWRVSLDHRFTPDLMVYASYNRGFKSGGYSPSFPNDVPYLPEKIDAYELGVKSELADNSVRLNVAGFYYDYTNIQVARFQNGAIGIYNGAEAEIWGLDADLDWAVSRNFDLYAGVSWLDPNFTHFPQGVGATPNPAGGFSQVINQDFSGNDLPNAPRFTAVLGGELRFPTGNGVFAVAANYNYNDGFYTQEDNLLRQASFQMLNASLRWTSPDERYVASLWGRNLFDEAVITQKIAGSTNGLETFQPPRTFGVTLEAKF